MADDPCHEMRLLIQADVDGELEPAEAARVAAHLDTCPGCAALQRRLIALSARLRAELPQPPAPARLRVAVRRSVTARRRHARPPPWLIGSLSAAALAACLALFLLPAADDAMPQMMVAAHLRALQPQHLVDVASSEQHTVKPWFAGRLPFSPPVQDFAAQGFPLVGGRLDQLPGQPVAALVYRRRNHVIDLFVWPVAGESPQLAGGPESGRREGYNFIRWSAGEMRFWAVSDLNAAELAAFADLWRRT